MNFVRDDVAFLARSDNRMWLLRTLSEHREMSWKELQSETKASRPTLQRNLNALENKGLIKTNSARDYTLTLAGKCVSARFAELLETIRAARELGTAAKLFSGEHFEIDIRHLSDAELIMSTRENPYAPPDRQLDLMESADTFQWLLSTIGLRSLRTVRDCVVNQHSHHRVIIDPTVAEKLSSDSRYIETIQDLMATDHCEIYVSESEIPFYLGVSDAVVQFGTLDDDGRLKAIIETDEDTTRAWAHSTLDSYQQSSEPSHQSLLSDTA